jgi:hypothetical protein
MTKRTCPWCGGENLRRIGSNTLQDPLHETDPTNHPYWMSVVYWEDRECGCREVATPDEVYDYKLSKCVDVETKVIRFHIPTPHLPVDKLPDYLKGKV